MSAWSAPVWMPLRLCMRKRPAQRARCTHEGWEGRRATTNGVWADMSVPTQACKQLQHEPAIATLAAPCQLHEQQHVRHMPLQSHPKQSNNQCT
eukprot:359258-Chlamydomonas_euryale.AAC.28